MSSSTEDPQLPMSFLQKVDIVPALLQVVGAALVAAITGPFRGKSGARKYKHHVAHAAFRTLEYRLSPAQVHYVQPSTEKGYEGACKSHKLEVQTDKLPNGTKAHWIGKRDAKHVWVFYHGGGFVMPMNPAYLEFLIPTVEELNASGKDFAIVILSYTLAPIKQYPTQLEQCVEFLRWVLSLPGRSPATTIIGGDSAGGNLTLGVLSHLSHPHPAIRPLDISADNPLKGALLISPWASFDVSVPSIKANQYKDCISPKVGPLWSQAMLGNAKPDNYNEALLAPVDWWRGLKVKDVLIVGGTDEILLDCVRAISKKIEDAHPNTTTMIANGETHDAMLLNPALGDMAPTEQGNVLKSWLSARL